MIFVTVGSQKFQFNRLLIAIDELVEKGKIEEVFAQIGYSDYEPKNYKFEKFIDRDKFSEMQDKSNIVITHAGTGAIVGALKKGKKVIAVPRLSRYGEHVDDHQLQIIEQFKMLNLIYSVNNCDELEKALAEIENCVFDKYVSNTQTIIDSIVEYIEA